MAQCINTSECASQYFVHGSLYDLLLIMSIICHLHSLLGIRCLLDTFANIMNYSQKPWRTRTRKTKQMTFRKRQSQRTCQEGNDNKSTQEHKKQSVQTRCEEKQMKVTRGDQIISDCSHTRFQVVLAAALFPGFLRSSSSSLHPLSVEQIDGERHRNGALLLPCIGQ